MFVFKQCLRRICRPHTLVTFAYQRLMSFQKLSFFEMNTCQLLTLLSKWNHQVYSVNKLPGIRILSRIDFLFANHFEISKQKHGSREIARERSNDRKAEIQVRNPLNSVRNHDLFIGPCSRF